MKDNERLNRTIKEIASKYNIETGESEFCKFTKIKYVRYVTGNRHVFKISDYLVKAPDDVLEAYVETMITNIFRKNKYYPSKVMDWLLSDEFLISCRPIRLQRSKNISGNTVGKARDLGESLDRLMDMGLVKESDLDGAYYTWTSRPNYRKVGECDILFRTVTISCALDSEKVPEKVLDYVVYHETVHLRRGYRPGEAAHGRKFKELENLYPDGKWCNDFISRNLRKK